MAPKRKAAPTHKSDKEVKHFLSDLRFFLLPFGQGLTQRRREILKKSIEKAGGSVIDFGSQPSEHTLDFLKKQCISHFVTGDTATPATVQRLWNLCCPAQNRDARHELPISEEQKEEHSTEVALQDARKCRQNCLARLASLLAPSLDHLPPYLKNSEAIEQSWKPAWVTLKFVTDALQTKTKPRDTTNYECRDAIWATFNDAALQEAFPEAENIDKTPPRKRQQRNESPETKPHLKKTKKEHDDEHASAEHSTSGPRGGTPLKRSQQRVLANKHKFACQKPVSRPKPSNVVNVDDAEGQEELSEDELMWSGVAEAKERLVVPSTKPSEGDDAQLTPLMENKNPEITQMLRRLFELYKEQGSEPWRARNYSIAVSIVESLPFKIERPEDLERKEVRLGAKTKEKIAEFLRTGKVQKLQALEDNPKLKIIRQFTGVWGIAAMTAEKLYSKGYRTLDDLRKHKDELNANQQIGLEFYDEFRQKIPRAEIHEILNRVKKAARQMFSKDDLSIVACGSFRRGKTLCGDIDILFCKRSDSPFGNELSRIVHALHHDGLLTHDLIDLDHKKGKHNILTYMGVCQLTPRHLHRRIDFKMYTSREYAFALLHFTGSDHFNRSMRLFAKRLGYSLTDHGLFAVVRQGTEKTPISEPFICRTEKEIFDVLGLDYRHPWEREVDIKWTEELASAVKEIKDDLELSEASDG